MRVRFLLGAAGSGKTHRCLAEIRTRLATDPGGPPLLLIAPKQATFQLERQLLAESDLAGSVRLRILSFDRLANFVLEQRRVAPPKFLGEDGRLMVLRALLRQHQAEMTLFGRSVNRPGFAAELGGLLTELQEHGFSPTKLHQLAQKRSLAAELRDKLNDLARLQEFYERWLTEHGLQDAGRLLDHATAALRATDARHAPELNFAGLWLDGFAEMTPQEHDLLAAVLPFCAEATLAFCVDPTRLGTAEPLSIWSLIGKTVQHCQERVRSISGQSMEVETLPSGEGQGRFAKNAVLARLEHGWTRPEKSATTTASDPSAKLQLVECLNAETEAVLAAREIWRLVRSGGRFRECAVLVRQLEPYHQTLARVFRRYQIPFFLDRRESVAHHPLAELTRNALRTVTFDWETPDWFGALKTGFAPVLEERLNELENLALESGWTGEVWRKGLPDPGAEALRQLIVPPYEQLHARMAQTGFAPSGAELADALREFWDALAAGETLERWAGEAPVGGTGLAAPAVHATVWEQLQGWLDNLALAFPREAMPLSEWLPVLEAGLMNLTVGVIPPALDEVLVGAVDRARNPELRAVFLLGVNEGVFPAPPESPVILTNADREALESHSAPLGANLFDRISREHYLGYIACTRSAEQLWVTYARQGPDGKLLNPSTFLARLQRLFPELAVTRFQIPAAPETAARAEQACELAAPLVRYREATEPETIRWSQLLNHPALAPLRETLARLAGPGAHETISPALADRLYGPVLRSSVSRLEEFAQCPFRFFVSSGLRAEERRLFELDARERGSFQHEVLDRFTKSLAAENKPWRDLRLDEARNRVAAIANEVATGAYRHGLMQYTPWNRLAARLLTEPIQEFIATLITWMQGQYEFNPERSEVGFGFENNSEPAWEVALDAGHRLALRGRIDRLDIHREGGRALVAVMDYKSSAHKLDPLLMRNGIQLQLPGYLAAIRSWPAERLGATEAIPAGVFYVNLRRAHDSGGSRTAVLEDPEAARVAWRHLGRLDATWLRKFDSRNEVKKGDQFGYTLNQDGSLRSNNSTALPGPEFRRMLDEVERQLRTLGEQIFAGDTAVNPYRKGSQTACDRCDLRAICRLDPWTHVWRVLRAEAIDETETAETSGN